MAEDTKTCSLTDEEINQLIQWHGYKLTNDGFDNHIERLNYLNRRLKADKKEGKPDVQFTADAKEPTEQKAAVSW